MATPQPLAMAPLPPYMVLEICNYHKDVHAKRDLGGDSAPIIGEGRGLVGAGPVRGTERISDSISSEAQGSASPRRSLPLQSPRGNRTFCSVPGLQPDPRSPQGHILVCFCQVLLSLGPLLGCAAAAMPARSCALLGQPSHCTWH